MDISRSMIPRVFLIVGAFFLIVFLLVLFLIIRGVFGLFRFAGNVVEEVPVAQVQQQETVVLSEQVNATVSGVINDVAFNENWVDVVRAEDQKRVRVHIMNKTIFDNPAGEAGIYDIKAGDSFTPRGYYENDEKFIAVDVADSK